MVQSIPDMAVSKALNKAALVNLYNIGGKELVVSMIDRFIQGTPSRIENARASAGRQDWRSLHLVAHSLKATAANVGTDRLRELADQLEESAGSGRHDEVETLLAELDALYLEAESHLRSERSLWQA